MLHKELENIEAKDQLPREENATRLIQPIKGGETSKKVRPPPFYVSLIIGDKLVHNCMIDSGASSSSMPSSVANLLDIKYEPIVRDVLQYNGSSIKTIGVLKNVEMTLHGFPSCSITQDI